MSKVSTASGKTPMHLPTQSAWAKGPPQSNSSSAPSPRSQSFEPSHTAIPISHSRRPSALGQGVSVKDGVAVPRNNVGSVRPASVVFGSIDDASAPVSSSPASTPAIKSEVIKSFGTLPATSSNHVNGKTLASTSARRSSKQQPSRTSLLSPSNSSTTSNSATSTSSTSKPTINKADITKLFQNPSSSSSSSQPSSDTSSPSIRPPNLPPHHQPSSSMSQPLPQPSQLGADSYPQFVPGMRQPQQGAGTPRSPASPRAVANMPVQSHPGAGPGGPGGPPIPASPRMAPHQHQAPPTGVPPQVPIQPMQWTGYYYPMDPYNQPQHPWYYTMPSPHMHQPPHQHGPHTAHPHASPRPAAPQLPGTPTIAHAIPHPPHTPQPPQSASSPPPTPSTANASAFVPGGRPSAKFIIKSQDGMEVTLDALKKHSPQPPTVPIPPASPVVTSRRITSIRMESEEARRMREDSLRKEQEKKDAEERAKEEAEEKKKREEEEQGRLRREEEAHLEAQWKEEEEKARIVREEEERKQKDALEMEEAQLEADEVNGIVETLSPVSELEEPEDGEVFEADEVSHPQPNGDSNCSRSKRGEKRSDPNKVPLSQQGQGSAFGSSSIAPIPGAGLEPVAPVKLSANRWVPTSGLRKVKALLNKFTMVPIQPMQWTGYYYPMDPYNQPSHQHGPHTAPRSPIPASPRPLVPQLPDSPHTRQPPQSVSSPQPSTSNARLNMNASAFAPGERPSAKVTIRSQDGMEVTLDALKEHSLQPPTIPTPLAPPVMTNRRTTSIRIESEDVPTNVVRKTQPDVDSPDMVDLKVKVLLNQLTVERFDSLSDQIIRWVNTSVGEEDERMLNQVTQLVFEKATHEVALSEMYARLCQEMMEQISPDVKDNRTKNHKKPIAGGQLFRKCLLHHCQAYFERGQFAWKTTAAVEASADQATEAVSEEDGNHEARLYFDAVRTAKRKALGFIKFISELFKLQMLTEHTMHEYMKKLFGNAENPEEERIECLCLLLKTVGQFLDTPRARAHMDVYVMRMKEMSKSTNISCSMQFMLQDVIELRERKWVGLNAVTTPVTIAAVDKAKEPLWMDTPCMHMSIPREIAQSRRGSLDLASEKRDSFAPPPPAPRITHAILNLSEMEYPEGIKKPSTELNVNVTNGRFRYDRDFLLQFMHICKERPHALAPIRELGIEAVDQPSIPSARGSSGRHRSTSRSTSQPVNLDIGISKMYNFESTGSKLTNEEHFNLLPGGGFSLTSGYLQSPVVRMPSQGSPSGPNGKKNNRTRTKRGVPQKALWSQQGQSSYFGASIPTYISEADAKRKIDDDVKEFFAVRDLKEADVYLSNLPREHHFRLVERLIAYALESKEADARLVAEFFARATSNGQCTLEVFEEGFVPIVELLDDIAIDAPKAFDYMAIMLKGAGFEKEPNRLHRIAWKLRAEDRSRLVSLVTTAEKVGEQESQTDSSLNMFCIFSEAPEPTPEASTTHCHPTSWKPDVGSVQTGGPEPGSSMCNTVDQSPEALLRKRLKLLPRFRPPVVNNAPGDMKQEIGATLPGLT